MVRLLREVAPRILSVCQKMGVRACDVPELRWAEPIMLNPALHPQLIRGFTWYEGESLNFTGWSVTKQKHLHCEVQMKYITGTMWDQNKEARRAIYQHKYEQEAELARERNNSVKQLQEKLQSDSARLQDEIVVTQREKPSALRRATRYQSAARPRSAV